MSFQLFSVLQILILILLNTLMDRAQLFIAYFLQGLTIELYRKVLKKTADFLGVRMDDGHTRYDRMERAYPRIRGVAYSETCVKKNVIRIFIARLPRAV